MKKLILFLFFGLPMIGMCDAQFTNVVIKYQGIDSAKISQENYIAITYDEIVGYGGATYMYLSINNADGVNGTTFTYSHDQIVTLPSRPDGTRWVYYTTPSFPGNNVVQCGYSSTIKLYIIPSVSTGIISPMGTNQNDGKVYYYTLTGELAGTANTKEKPNISEGLYIFKIEYFDNTYCSGKIVF